MYFGHDSIFGGPGEGGRTCSYCVSLVGCLCNSTRDRGIEPAGKGGGGGGVGGGFLHDYSLRLIP